MLPPIWLAGHIGWFAEWWIARNTQRAFGIDCPLRPTRLAAIDPQGTRSWMELLFLSFTTLSSTGLSDVIPVKASARSFVMIEQLAGLGYVAMVVSRLVALTVLGRPRARP